MVLFKSNLDIIGMIGIILLIGIVKKNAIMMIDFALAAERNDGMSSRDAILPGVPAPLPADHDDDHVCAPGCDADGARLGCGRRAAQGLSASPLSAASWSARC